MSVWAQLGAPFGAAMLLVAISTWFGLHVLRRGVIFVDLALAQVAALGGMCAFLVGLEPGSTGAAGFALVFALMGAALLSLLRPHPGSRVPQEALIGLVYAFAAALALLVMAKAPEGAEHFRETLTGSLLWVRWEKVGEAALIYGAVALLHFFGRRPLRRISDDPEGAAESGVRLGVWDFIFYGSFAVVVTHAVSIAGVLLVFVFLVAPATLALLWFRSLSTQLIFGWALGLLVCVVGLVASLHLDLPASPTVVGIYAAVLAVAGAVAWLRRAAPAERLRRAAGLVGVPAVAGLALFGLSGMTEEHGHGEHSGLAAAQGAPASAAAMTPARGLLERVAAVDLPEEKRAACATETRSEVLRGALDVASDAFDRLALATCLGKVDATAGAVALRALAADGSLPGLVRMEARAAVAGSDARE